jgi:acyl carrier protein
MEILNQELFENLTITSSENAQVDNSSQMNETIKTSTDIQDWLVSYLAQILDIDSNDILKTSSWGRYGLDSSATICLTNDLGDWLGCSVDPTITYSYPTIEALANHLANS